ncbi:SAC3/GANP/Nin1/mts3/eIF-3 p25 family [Striga hermonthica]|uniref:SAC3/GANP/Nin1/mts3/eIF-3 p25 family n=1 Tax=Striga hermonthica TaxID=68872 RepID=A0A9N7NK06_STRHE|nr:SAC3/GANP/Nin1/mts3/eIF-3 p25 family [Striga hermonthica]
MADKNRQPYKPINRRNYSSSSSSSHSNYTKPRRPNYPHHSNPNSDRSAITSSNSSRNYTDNDNQDFPTLVGTFPFMCPVEERERRERLRDLAVFERLHGDPARTSPTLAVKKFCRTISSKDVKASDVRPVPVLEETLDYLLSLLHSSDRSFEVVHDFIFDRIRSIRQDLSMQNVVSDQVIRMYERMVKFHIISYYNLRRSGGTQDTASMSHLNLEQLMKVLTTLFNLYEAHRAAHSMCQNEAEFYSFYLLLHLGSHNQGEPLSLWLRRIPSGILKSKEICFARALLRCYRLGNYRRFINITEKEASFLQNCLIEPYINEARVLALSCISYGGYKLQPYPLVYLSKLLMLKESDVESLCIDCGLEISDGETGKGLISTKELVIVKQSRGFQKYYPIHSERIERLFAEMSDV